MLSLILAATLSTATLNPVRVAVGESVIVEVDISPDKMWYGGYFRSANNRIAGAEGHFAVRASKDRARVTGVRPGETQLQIEYVSGMSVNRRSVATIYVFEKCEEPTVALPATTMRVPEGQAIDLEAVVGGTEPVDVAWFEDDRQLDPRGLTLPRGTHRLTVRATNRCGMATATLEVEVFASRRRAAGH